MSLYIMQVLTVYFFSEEGLSYMLWHGIDYKYDNIIDSDQLNSIKSHS